LLVSYSNVDDEDELLYGDTDTSVFSGAMDTSQSEAKRYHPLHE